MIYGSVCSGIEAATVAWEPLGWRAAFFSEIEAFPRAMLEQRFPAVPRHGDFTTIEADTYEPIDLLVGGTPCQDFSVAGLRKGLAGERGNLTIEFVRLAGRLRPRWLVWENVPGVLSIDGGRAFGAFLGGLGQFGYGFAYRVLDAQHFGVPQRRRRVFVVGYLGDWRPAAAVLFEPESLRGDTPPRRGKGQNAPTIPSRSTAGGGLGTDFDCDDGLIAAGVAPPVTSNPYGDHESREGLLVAFDARNGIETGETTISIQAGGDCKRGYSLNTIPLAYGGNNTSGLVDIATACNAHGGPHGRLDFESETFVTHSLRADGFDASEDGTGRGTPLTLAIRGRGDSHDLEYRDDGIANAILTPSGGRAGIGVGAVAFEPRMRGDDGRGYVRAPHFSDESPALNTVKQPAVATAMSVRRLTPRECERLQGFPDDYTNIIGYDSRRTGKFGGNRGVADGPRYRALGNSMAVPCMTWLGRRIEFIKAVMECAP